MTSEPSRPSGASGGGRSTARHSCPSCGEAATPTQRFCLACGTSLELATCPSCGSARVRGARFCGHCGTRLLGGPDEPVAQARTDGAGEGTAAVSGDAAAGQRSEERVTERRLVSVVFADLVGYTARAEAEDPEAVREFLSAYFERAASIVERHGGIVEKFIGDAVMAVWGTPTAHEDDAERAVRAALDMVAAVRDLDGSSELRAAVTTGEAAVDRSAKGQGMVTGDLVNTSSRLQAVAPSGTVLVDETTMNAAGRAIAFEPAGSFELKGKSEPVAGWTALRVVGERGGAGRHETLEPPFVGRESELRTLKEAMHATGREGHARLVTIIGQAGLDKSRLAWELKKYSDGVMDDIYWHEGRSPAYGQGVAFWALSQMVRARCRIGDEDDPEQVMSRLRESLEMYIADADERDWMEPYLAALLGVADTPPGSREELFTSWRLFFERISERGTVALIFDDLHVAEEGIFDFIDHLLEWADDRPIFVVALARPELLERRPRWGSGHVTSTLIHLKPLPDAAMQELLLGMVPGLPEATAASIVERAEGVPLYAVEIVRMMIDRGALVRDGDRYRLGEDGPADSIPASLQALIAARLDALEPETRALVQDAAVLGRSFPVSGLAEVSGRDRESLEALLRDLVRAEILGRESRRPGSSDATYAFVQSMVREVAYTTLARRDRSARHAAAARYLESLDDDEVAGLIASHYLDAFKATPDGPARAAARSRAQKALVAAAERSISMHANHAAVSFVEQALEVTDEPEERARLWRMASEPAIAAYGVERGRRFLRDAIDWYLANERTAEADEAIARLGQIHDNSEDVGELLDLLEAAVARIDDHAPTSTGARLLVALAGTYLYIDRIQDAVAPIERGLALAERIPDASAIANLFTAKAWLMGAQGRHREAALFGEGSLQLLEGRGELVAELGAHMNASNAYIASDPARGLEIATRGVELAERFGEADRAAYLAGNEGTCAVLLGRWNLPLKRSAELDRPLVGGFGRLGLVGIGLIARAHLGLLDERAEEVMAQVPADDVEPLQRRSIVGALSALAVYASGRLEDVEAAVSGAGRGTTNPMESALARCAVAHAQTWLGQRDRLASTIEQLAADAGMGEVISVSIAQARGALAAMDGRTIEAEEAYRATLTVWRRLGMLPDVVTAELEMLRLLGDDLGDRDAVAADADRIIEQLGSVTLRRRFNEIAEVTPAFEVLA